MGYLRVYLDDKLTDQFELTKDRLTIGRSAESDLVLPNSGVSRHHATIVRDGAHFFIEDNKSSNGVFLNKDRVERAQLNFWDEIQIYNFVLKFMAVPRRGVEKEPDSSDDETVVGKTVMVSLEDNDGLERVRKQKKIAYLIQSYADGTSARHPIRSVKFSCGRSKQCDVHLPGWFGPSEAARVERNGSTYQLVPDKRGKVVLNGEPVDSPQTLKDEDRFEVRKVAFQFFNRLPEV